MADVLYFTTQFDIKIDFFKSIVQLGQSSPAKGLAAVLRGCGGMTGPLENLTFCLEPGLI